MMLENLNIQKISMSKYTASAREIVNANILIKFQISLKASMTFQGVTNP